MTHPLSPKTASGIAPLQPSAASKFHVYGPSDEGPSQIRKPQVEVMKDSIECLRHLATELKKMPPEAVYGMIEWHGRLNLFEAVRFAKATGKLMVPNSILDRVVTETGQRIGSTRTGTMVIYEAPDKPFGAKVVFKPDNMFFGSIEFSIPSQFRGRINCALVVEHPDFDLIHIGDQRYRLIVQDTSRLHLVEWVPANELYTSVPDRDTFHLPDPEFGIPYGASVTKSPYSRCLVRVETSYIGVPWRSNGGGPAFVDWERYISLQAPLDAVMGVALI